MFVASWKWFTFHFLKMCFYCSSFCCRCVFFFHHIIYVFVLLQESFYRDDNDIQSKYSLFFSKTEQKKKVSKEKSRKNVACFVVAQRNSSSKNKAQWIMNLRSVTRYQKQANTLRQHKEFHFVNISLFIFSLHTAPTSPPPLLSALHTQNNGWEKLHKKTQIEKKIKKEKHQQQICRTHEKNYNNNKFRTLQTQKYVFRSLSASHSFDLFLCFSVRKLCVRTRYQI